MMKENGKNKKREEDIGRFLIIRFLGVMVIIYLLNIVIELFVQKIYSPFLINTLQIDEIGLGTNDIGTWIRIIAAMLLGRLPLKLPGAIQSFLFAPIMNVLNVSVITPENVSEKGSFFVFLYYFTVFACLLVIVFLSVIPYLLGGLWFINSVRIKMNELRELDRIRTAEAEKQRNLLLSDIAHDIKTPITSMSGYAKAINDGLVSDQKREEYLNNIYSKSMRVSELMEMFFEYIKMDSAGYSLSKSSEDIAEIVRSSVADMYQDLEDAGLDIEINLPEEECLYEVDKLQFSRVITNLLGNAVKYLEQGDRVKVSLKKYEKSRPDNLRYKIIVEDSGIRIDEDLAERIFTPFSRGDNTRNTKGGTGLGLSIAYKIIDLHGGKMELDQKLTDGYTKAFVIRL